MNAFKHGLATIQKLREESITTEHEESVRQQILDGLIADKGGHEQISTATRTARKLVRDWARRHRLELMTNWKNIEEGRPLNRIKPLE